MDKFLALFVALMIVVASMSVALAEDGHTISVQSTDTHTYKVFQVLTGTLSGEGSTALGDPKWGADWIEREGSRMASLALPASALPYADIITMERPVHVNDLFSRRHPKMTQQHRAKIFAPFAALTGFEEHIRGKEVQYVPRRALDPADADRLQRILTRLHQLTYNRRLAAQNRVTVQVEFFLVCTDPFSEAFGTMGTYKRYIGIVRRVDPVERMLTITDPADGETAIPLQDIADLKTIDTRQHQC